MLLRKRFQILRDLWRARNAVDGWRSHALRRSVRAGAGAKVIWLVMCVICVMLRR
jgi:hypothetical protein